EASRSGPIVTTPASATKRRFSRRPYKTAVAGMIVAAVVASVVAHQMAFRVQRVDIELSPSESIPPTHSSEVVLSPDGTLLAYASTKTEEGPMMATTTQDRGGGAPDLIDLGSLMQPMAMMTEQIYVRSLGQQQAKPIGGALGGAPFFSPDGKWL